MTVTKQCVGIDISKSDFTVCICNRYQDDTLSFSDVKKFKNDKTGFNQLLRWVRKNKCSHLTPVYLMEATGVYYENLAHHLYKIKQRVHVVLPNTSKHYFCSLNIKTKTDEVDARILSRFGVERIHKVWQPPSPILLKLRNLTRYKVQLQEQKTALNNIKHSKESAHDIQQFILKSNKKIIDHLDKQISQVQKQIKQLVSTDQQLSQKVEKLLTIKGVGFDTIVTIMAETLGFEQVNNVKQLVSYAGYDVVKRESGSSIKGKTRISKKGNRYIRNALYFPAMVACRYNQALKQTYLRINQKKPSKMIGQVAIQRKILILIYSLWKNDTVYIENYKNVASTKIAKATLDSPD